MLWITTVAKMYLYFRIFFNMSQQMLAGQAFPLQLQITYKMNHKVIIGKYSNTGSAQIQQIEKPVLYKTVLP